MIGRPVLLFAIFLASLLLLAAPAQAERAAYRGAHTIPSDRAGHFCHIEAPHTHSYTPEETSTVLFARHTANAAPQFEFVADPSDYGYEGPLVAYFGPHPAHFEGGSSQIDVACNSHGDHYHLRAPLDETRYESKRGILYFENYKEARRAARKLRQESSNSAAPEVGRSTGRSSLKSLLQEPAKKPKRRSTSLSKLLQEEPEAAVKAAPSKPAAKAAPSKARTSAHRSWMDRRRGR